MKFELKQIVKISETDQSGTVIGRAEYLDRNDLYLLRYRNATGDLAEEWYSESALQAV